MKLYENMQITNADNAPALEENAWGGPLLAYIIAVYGSAWAYCSAMCGWGQVRRCDTGWFPPRVTAVCK